MVAPNTGVTPLVPYVIQDRYPLHYGASATVATVTSLLRLAELGYRVQYCDYLREAIEGDPHAFSVIQTRVNAVVGRPWKMIPAKTEEGNESEAKKATIVANFVTEALKAIPDWRKHMAGMMWALVYAVEAREIIWWRRSDGAILPKRLQFIHTRRLAYDINWKLVWTEYGQTNTGQPLENYPGKFLVFEPSLADEYPTREGLGRTLAHWLAFKRFDVREMLSYLERFGKPYPDISYKTNRDDSSDEDISLARDLAKRFGAGGMAGCYHPDTLTVELKGNGSGQNSGGGSGESTPHKALIALIDEQISKLVLGQAYTTNSGQKMGLGNSGKPFEGISQDYAVADATQRDEMIDRDLVYWIVLFNFGEEAVRKYMPHFLTEMEDPEDADAVAARVDKYVRLGYPMPVEYVAERNGWAMPVEGDEVLSASGVSKYYQPPTEPTEEEDQGDEEEGEEPADDAKGKDSSDDAGESGADETDNEDDEDSK